MPRMIRSSLTPPSLTSSVSMVRPSRMIVMASEICSISLSLWLIMMQVMPRSRRPPSRSSRFWLSPSFSAAVGSSRMSSLTSLASALAISTSCCLPMPMSRIDRVGVLVQAHAGEQLDGALAGVEPVDDAALGVLVAEEEVLGDRQQRDERELLVDDDDAGALGVADVVELHLLALEEDLAAVGAVRVDPGEHLHQGRLPGAVLAADAVDLAALARRSSRRTAPGRPGTPW